MAWFRRRQKDAQEEGAATVVAAPVAAPAPARAAQPDPIPAAPAPVGERGDAGEQGEQDASPDAESPDGPKRKRRRGSRGGRGRKKPGAGGETAGEDRPAETPVKTRQAASARQQKEAKEPRDKEPKERRQPRAASRRRQPPRRAPLPAAKRELLISVDVGEQRVAVIEDERVAEVYLERPERRSIAGNIYLGVVDNVLPGMEAAFVEIGLEKNGFLYVDEIVVPELEGKRHGKKIQDLISRGEKLLVQAVKDPMKTKGARLTTEISLPGRFLVYVPNGEGLGVSRRLDDGERQRLKDILRELDAKGGGIIVRTAADGASAEDVERDLVFLQRLWATIQARAKTATAPELVYQEAELPLRIVRDLFAGDFVSATIDHDRTHKRIVGYLKKTSPHMIERVHRYKEKTPLFEANGVDREIQSTLDRRVDLPSGGYLIFDYAEAFTVVDVNTGRFVGSRSKTSSARLEDTITKNNLEAVKEVVRQLRLRDIGGIIVIDFIDMANPKNRAQVEEALRTELERDRTKTYVVEISPLGLVEMTRQNVTDGPREILTRKCPVCEGDGIVVSDQTVAMEIERKLRALGSSASRVQAYRVAVHPRILGLLAGPGGSRLAELEELTKRRFFLVAAENGHVHTNHFDVLAEGKVVDLEPESPVAEGAELEVKLGELALHDAGAGVGKVAGIDVSVAGAAKLVGKKAKVRVGRVLDGQAFATLVDAGGDAVPITFESEAEKPTRAPARRKATAAPVEAEEAEAEIVEDGEIEDAEEAETLAESEDDETGDEAAAPRKRTRRGSRGGRRRKRPASQAAEPGEEVADEEGELQPDGPGDADVPVEADAGDGAAPAPRRRRTPKIHVPAADLATTNGDAVDAPPASADVEAEPRAEDGTEADAGAEPGDGSEPAAPRKRTRRGSRGGRRRRKPAGAGAAGADEEHGAEPDGEPFDDDAETDADAEVEPAPEAEPGPEIEAVPAPVAASDAQPAPRDRPDGYVPMSEWLEDFDR